MFTLSLLGPGYLTLARPWMEDWIGACRERVLPPPALAGHRASITRLEVS